MAIGVVEAVTRDKEPFNETKPEAHRIPNKARLVLFSDWGSGTAHAVALTDQMKPFIAEFAAENEACHAIHLGDVYYTGQPDEQGANVLGVCPVDKDQDDRIGSWALPGNHDMYSGGKGYFENLLGHPLFARQQRSSYFNLVNDYWNIVGLDTAWDDHALHDPQASWVEESHSGLPEQKLMLLSHHQLFSAYDDVPPELGDKLKTLLDADAVHAWFWGHEHRCVLYQPHMGVKFARCIGNGGIPAFPSDPAKRIYPDVVLDELIETVHYDDIDWLRLSFAVVDLDNESATVRYVDETGSVFHPNDVIT